MRVAFHLRLNDHRARMLCKTPHRSRPSEYSCMPLNMLEIARDGSCLQLCRRRRQGTELVMWANLSFTNIESTFLLPDPGGEKRNILLMFHGEQL